MFVEYEGMPGELMWQTSGAPHQLHIAPAVKQPASGGFKKKDGLPRRQKGPVPGLASEQTSTAGQQPNSGCCSCQSLMPVYTLAPVMSNYLAAKMHVLPLPWQLVTMTSSYVSLWCTGATEDMQPSVTGYSAPQSWGTPPPLDPPDMPGINRAGLLNLR